MSEENGADLSVNVAGQAVTVRNIKSLNTFATVATLIVCICGFTVGWFVMDAHSKGAEKNETALISALKDQTAAIKDGAAAQREQTCILKFEGPQRQANSDFCKQVSGSR